MPIWIISIKIIEFRDQLPGADRTIRRVKRHRHVPWAGISRARAARIKDRMRNCVFQDQSAKRVAQQYATMKFLIRRASRQRDFTDGRQTAVLRGDRFAGGLAAPER